MRGSSRRRQRPPVHETEDQEGREETGCSHVDEDKSTETHTSAILVVTRKRVSLPPPSTSSSSSSLLYVLRRARAARIERRRQSFGGRGRQEDARADARDTLERLTIATLYRLHLIVSCCAPASVSLLSGSSLTTQPPRSAPRDSHQITGFIALNSSTAQLSASAAALRLMKLGSSSCNANGCVNCCDNNYAAWRCAFTDARLHHFHD